MTTTSEQIEAVRPTAVDELLPPPKDAQTLLRLNNLGAVGETVLVRVDGKIKAGVVTDIFTMAGSPRRMSIQVATFTSQQLNYYTVAFCLNQNEAQQYAELVEKLDALKNPKIFNRGWNYGVVVAWPRNMAIGLFDSMIDAGLQKSRKRQ